MIQHATQGRTPPPVGGSAFAALGLSQHLCAAVSAAGYDTPTPIQIKAIPDVLLGRDLLGCAQTGTGKTAAFALPILHHLSSKRGGLRVLVLAPTRELAAQIGVSFAQYGRGSGLRHHVIFGGVGKAPQKAALRAGLDILVATPGRLLDLMGERAVDLSHVDHLVLDEADRMLDMGFIRDVKRIIAALPRERQTLLFSATMPEEIRDLSRNILRNPLHVAVDRVSSTCEPTSQAVYFVEKQDKLDLLLNLLDDRAQDIDRALVFTRTKHGANKVAKQLAGAGVPSAAIHGNKSQSARERALLEFKRGDLRVLVATDIAARGIDIKELSHVINHDLPNEPESYVHRVGRTGRAGLSGAAISFCATDERDYLRDIERLTARKLDRKVAPAGAVRRAPPQAQDDDRAPYSRDARRAPSRPAASRPHAHAPAARGARPASRDGAHGRRADAPASRDQRSAPASRDSHRAPASRDQRSAPASRDSHRAPASRDQRGAPASRDQRGAPPAPHRGQRSDAPMAPDLRRPHHRSEQAPAAPDLRRRDAATAGGDRPQGNRPPARRGR